MDKALGHTSVESDHRCSAPKHLALLFYAVLDNTMLDTLVANPLEGYPKML